MDWILSHLPLVIAFATFIAGWVSQQRKKSAEASSEQGSTRQSKTLPPPLKPAVPAEDQIRRVQEEVRRKIQERLSAPTAGPSESPFRPAPPALKPQPAPIQRRPIAPVKQPLQQSAKPSVLISSLEEQERENSRRNEERRREARRVDREVAQAADATRNAGSGSRLWMTAELQSPANLRRALVLAEVLGPPVSMRR